MDTSVCGDSGLKGRPRASFGSGAREQKSSLIPGNPHGLALGWCLACAAGRPGPFPRDRASLVTSSPAAPGESEGEWHVLTRSEPPGIIFYSVPIV